jgi:hypothetical protein
VAISVIVACHLLALTLATKFAMEELGFELLIFILRAINIFVILR